MGSVITLHRTDFTRQDAFNDIVKATNLEVNPADVEEVIFKAIGILIIKKRRLS